MIEIKIGNGQKQQLEGHNLEWVVQQIERRHADAQSVCIIVEIESPPAVNLILTTPTCVGSNRGIARTFTDYENEIIRL